MEEEKNGFYHYQSLQLHSGRIPLLTYLWAKDKEARLYRKFHAHYWKCKISLSPYSLCFCLFFPLSILHQVVFLLIERRPEELRYGSLGGNPFGVVPGSQVQKFKFRKVLTLSVTSQ